MIGQRKESPLSTSDFCKVEKYLDYMLRKQANPIFPGNMLQGFVHIKEKESSFNQIDKAAGSNMRPFLKLIQKKKADPSKVWQAGSPIWCPLL